MPLDVAGVPIRLRAHLVRLAPDRKAALRRGWSALRRVPAAPVVDAAADAWLAGQVEGLGGEVLEVGPHGVVARVLGRPAAVLDPWGRAEATYVGAVGPVLGHDRFDAVVAPRLDPDDPTAADPVAALVTLVRALRPGGVLVAVVVGSTGLDGLRAALGGSDAGAEVRVGPVEGSAATVVRVVRP